jgi:hypothetical protein
MKKHFKNGSLSPRILCVLILLVTIGFTLFAQDSLSAGNGKALNLPFRKYGLSIGNSRNFNGVRINFRDKDVQHINGLNLTGWTRDYGANEFVYGLNIGIIPSTRLSNGITFGLFGSGGECLNGLAYGTVAVGTKTVHGISIAGFVNASAGNIAGISFAGVYLFTHKSINGIAISVPFIHAEENINGFAIDVGYIKSQKKFNGMAVTAGYLNSATFKGVSFSGYSRSESMVGLSVALFNQTSELRGLQVGLLNYAGNNKKGLRMLPFFNVHL